MEMKYSINSKDFINKLRREQPNLLKRAERVADLIAREVVKNALTLTENTKPGVNPGEGDRRTYPGGWADVTTNLANSIKSRVELNGMRVHGIIEATMEYASALNEKEGYEVLGGADVAARKAIYKYQHLIFS